MHLSQQTCSNDDVQEGWAEGVLVRRVTVDVGVYVTCISSSHVPLGDMQV
jgi:hypothetical protein